MMAASPETLQPPPSAPARPSIITSYAGQNLAPLKPLLDIRGGDRKPQHYLTDALKERFNHYFGIEKATWREIASTGQLIDYFIQGKQLLQPNAYTGGWRIVKVPKEDEATKRVMNVMRFYETQAVVKWALSNPDIECVPGDDSDGARLASRAASVVWSNYERRFYEGDPWFNIREGKMALRFGSYVERVRFDTGAEGLKMIREVVEDKTITLDDGSGYCADCGKLSGANDFSKGTCPQCGSPSVLVEPANTARVQNVTGTEVVNTGEIVCEQLPLISCRWDLTKRAEESPWFIYSQRTSMAAARRLLGDIKLPQGESDDFSLDVLEGLAYTGAPVSGVSNRGARRKSELYREPVTVSEMWLSPDAYADIELRGDEQTLAGINVPKGKLTDLFPDGLVAVGLNGMSLVVGLYAERHRDHIVTGCWHMNPLSGAGTGMNDTVEVQKRLNTFDSQLTNFWGSTATPATLYVEGAVAADEARYIGHPKTNIPVKMERLPAELKSLASLVHQLPPGSPAAGFLQYTYEQLTNFAQITSGNITLTGAFPNVNNKTATGAQITDANSNALFTPPLQLKGGIRKRVAEIVCELYRKHVPYERSFLAGNRQGRRSWVHFSGADLRGRVEFEIVKDSEHPKNIFAKQQSLMAFLEGVGGIQGYMALRQSAPHVLAEWERVFDVDLKSDDEDDVSSLCDARLDKLKQQAKAISDPVALVESLQPPVSQYEPKHQEKAEWWQSWLDSDEGQEAGPVLRGAAEQMIQLHFNHGVVQGATKAAGQGVVQTAGAAPAAIGQQMVEQQGQPPPGQQAQLQAQQTALEQQAQAAEQAHEAAQNEANRQHELTKLAMEHPDSQQKIAESINFKDLPPSGQSQLARQAGIDISTPEVKQHLESQKPTQNGSKAK